MDATLDALLARLPALPPSLQSLHLPDALQSLPVAVVALAAYYLLQAIVTRLVARVTRRTHPSRIMSISVKWGREKFQLKLPPPDTKLAVIRNVLADHTHLDRDSFKLLYHGAIMKDNNAPISQYGIRDESTLVMIGGDKPLPAAASSDASATHKPSERPTEQSTVIRIRSELDKVRTELAPSLETFLQAIASYPARPTPAAASTAIPGQKNPIEQEHSRLGELLLQSLLRLDAIIPEGSWDEARRERKGAVREVQTLLDRLDGGWQARP